MTAAFAKPSPVSNPSDDLILFLDCTPSPIATPPKMMPATSKPKIPHTNAPIALPSRFGAKLLIDVFMYFGISGGGKEVTSKN